MKKEQQNADKQEASLERALETLKNYVIELAGQADMGEQWGEELWERINRSPQVRRELAYYHDYGKFLCEYQVAGYTLADIVIWQVDHFKAYMDRHEAMNRYRQERLLLTAFDVMLKMEKNPRPFIEKMRDETGTDRQNP